MSPLKRYVDRKIDQLRETLGSGSDAERLAAVRMLEPSCELLAQADIWLWTLVSRLLRMNLLAEVASLLWPIERFDPRPECVQRIWNAIQAEPKLILMGCGSAGKTYSSAAWFLLDWLRDPGFCNTKILSSTAGHAKSNIFSTLHMLHAESRIKLPGVRLDGFIGLDSRNRHAGISRVSIPQGENQKAALSGFHPLPRGSPDPIFGNVGKVRGLIDEAEEVAHGLWLGISNMLLSMEGSDLIKVVAACNPRDVLSPLAMYAAPECGWNRVQIDQDKEWTSKERWKVVRIDGADLENVREKRMVFQGFMTYGGFENLRLKGGGNSPEFFTLGRGMYPLEGAANTIIPLSYLDTITGTLLFVGQVVPVGSLDVAFEGDDEIIFTASRYGLAAGWRDPRTGQVHHFDKSRYCLQVDQFFALPKKRTIEQAEAVIELCERLAIAPEWVLIDRTGVGTGLHDALISMWDESVKGCNWGESATQKKILEDDTHLAFEEMDGISTEMYMALRRWVEFNYIKFSPTLDTEKLFKELTQRKYFLSTKGPTDLMRMRIQPKKEFKATYGWSPDRADSLVMGLHHVRMEGPERARATARSVVKRRRAVLGVVEKGGYIKWTPELDR